MKTIGQVLSEARESQKLTITDLSNKSSLSEHIISAIEEERYSDLPDGPFIRGYLRSLARALQLDEEHVLAVYRRDQKPARSPSLFPQGLMKPLGRKKPFLSVQRVGIALACLFLAVFLGVQILLAQKPPALTLDYPTDNQEVKNPVAVRGTTSTDAVVVINTVPTAINQDGVFQTALEMTPGQHAIVVESTGSNGRKSLVQHMINVVE